jgi:hypothetical protein
MAADDLGAQNPYRSTESGSHPVTDPILTDQAGGAAAAAHAVEPLARAGGWITFAGVLLILNGGALIMSIVGAVIGWLPLWMGILLTQAPARYREGVRLGDVELMREGSEKLRLVAKLWGIATIVSFCVIIFFYALVIILLLAGAIPRSEL